MADSCRLMLSLFSNDLVSGITICTATGSLKRNMLLPDLTCDYSPE